MRGAARVQRAAVEITFVGGGGAPAVGAQCRLVEPAKYICIVVDLFMLCYRDVDSEMAKVPIYHIYIVDVWRFML